jgi:hypothetical protein
MHADMREDRQKRTQKGKANTTYATGLHVPAGRVAKTGRQNDKADSNARESIDAIKAKLTGRTNASDVLG